MNNFLQLQDEEMQRFIEERQDSVREVVESRISTNQLIGDVVELFFPKLADTFTVMLGGEVIDPDPEYFTIEGNDEDEDEAPPSPPAGPGDRDEIIR